jgi:hypothetical protein
MFSMLLPLDPNAPRHINDHLLPPSGSWTDLLHDCWSAVLSLRTPTGHQALYRASSASYGAHRPENSVRRTSTSN